MDTIRNSTTTPPTSFIRDVRHNCDTHDFDAYVIVGDEAIYLGSRDSSWEAEALCDTYVYEQLMRQPPLEATSDSTLLPSTSTSALPVRFSALQNCRRFSTPPFSNAPCLWAYARMMRRCSG